MHHSPSLFSFFAVPNRFTSRKMHALENNKIIFSLKFQIVSTIVRRHNAPFTVLCFQRFLCSSESFQIPSGCMLQRYFFSFFSAVSNRFKYRHNACVRDIVLIFFSAVPNRFNYRQASECTIYRHCFQNILCSSKSFQIPSACMLQRYCFHFFLCCVPNNFNYRFLLKFSAVQIV